MDDDYDREYMISMVPDMYLCYLIRIPFYVTRCQERLCDNVLSVYVYTQTIYIYIYNALFSILYFNL